jgi:hypothetical protein
VKLYSIHRIPAGGDEDVLFVKEGFAWPAFLFPFIWLPARCLWFAFLLFVVALVALGLAEWAFNLDGSSVFGLYVLLCLGLGLEGNGLRRRAALRRGYVEEGVSVGRSLEEAELRYFARSVSLLAPAEPRSETA